ncbi:MAG: T9SS type B sorting domain-containing protein [Aquaticitalea sp.]
MNKRKYLIFFIIITLNWSFFSIAQTTLTHNCGPLIKTTNHSCSYTGGIYWARDFVLSSYGIDTNEELIITEGQVGISYTTWGAKVKFNIYEIDNNFPDSFSSATLIGSSQIQTLPYIQNPNATIITVVFDNPIIIPATAERILVEVQKVATVNASSLAHIAGTENDTGVSWYRGCIAGQEYINSDEIINSLWPGSNYNFFINITGTVNNTIYPFTLNYTNDCTETNKEFRLNNINNISSVLWDFGDPASGVNNNSTLISPTHDFSSSGQYSITATITQTDQTTYIINETISVAEPPIAYPITDIYACEDTFGSGISSSFDTSIIESEVLNGQTGVIVSYYNQNGDVLPSPLPNPFTNTQPNSQLITVRVSNSNDLCCFTETSFNLIVDTLPVIPQIDDMLSCDIDEDGFTLFDLTNLPIEIINGQSDLTVALYDSNNSLISVSDYTNFQNLTANQDYIKAIVTNSITNCSSQTNVNLIVNDNPEADQLQIIYGCDDNNDGISEYFNTSNVENQVLNGQTGMTVSYFDQSGNQLLSPLPNPFTNSNPFNELITIRVEDINTTCYAETILQLQTITQPNINQPNNLYSCELGDGYVEFDTSALEQEIIGNQIGLTIHYYDSNDNPLPSPLPILFQNTEPFTQTIHVRVEDTSNPICYSETSFELIVNDLPVINLEEEYFICNLEPSISLNINPSFNSYSWFFEDGTLISDTYNAEIIEEGSYFVTVTQFQNGITCENSFDFNLIRSELPEIQQVNYGDLGNNFIEIIAFGDGDFEYSLDGIYYQNSNYFPNIEGGCYTVYVRDKEGCGEDSQEVVIIDFPKFFTPNNDTFNDFWQIKGASKFPDSKLFIFDRYGKLLKQLSASSLGWDGTFNGNKMPSNDYWFIANLGNGRTFNGHFTLKR